MDDRRTSAQRNARGTRSVNRFRSGGRENVTRMEKSAPPEGKIDFFLFFAVFVLSTFGLVMVLSSGYYYDIVAGINPLASMSTQILCYCIGLALMLIIAYSPFKLFKVIKIPTMYKVAERGAIWIYLLAFGMLILTLLIGKTLNGAKRWLPGPISIQPGEFAKFALIMALAAMLSHRDEAGHTYASVSRRFLPGLSILGIWFLFTAMSAIPIYLQPNKSTLIIICVVALALYFTAGGNFWHVFLVGLVGVIAIAIILKSDEYSNNRLETFDITNFFRNDTSGLSYQIKQSIYAIASGGLVGTGLGLSKQKLLFLTYSDSDCIFSIICEELGFFGAILLIALYAYIFYRGIRIALLARDGFCKLYAAGLSILLIVQMGVNVCVATNLIPATGQTLPFISEGGTSLIMYMVFYGLLLNMSRNCDISSAITTKKPKKRAASPAQAQ